VSSNQENATSSNFVYEMKAVFPDLNITRKIRDQENQAKDSEGIGSSENKYKQK